MPQKWDTELSSSRELDFRLKELSETQAKNPY